MSYGSSRSSNFGKFVDRILPHRGKKKSEQNVDNSSTSASQLVPIPQTSKTGQSCAAASGASTNPNVSSILTPADAPNQAPENSDPEALPNDGAIGNGKKDLWRVAFEQLDGTLKSIFQADEEDIQGDRLSSVDILNDVIKETEARYEGYKRKGWKVARGKGKGEINVRDEAKKILSAALSLKDLVTAVVAFDPTKYGNPSYLMSTSLD